MRILFNTHPGAFDPPGGGEVQLLKSRQALQRLGAEVLLFDPWRPQFDAVDVVHHFSVQGGSMNFCSHVKRRGLPLVISPIFYLTEESRGTAPLGEIRDLLHLCDLALPNSQAEAEQLAAEFGVPREKFLVTHNGVDESFAAPADETLFRRRFGINGPFLLNVANVEPRKNQLPLAQAAGELGLKLVVLGHIRDAAYWRACRKAGGEGLVHAGYVEHDSALLPSAYRACEVFVLPSLLETPGLAALEAAAAGAKIVITAVGSAREYFGPRVRYVDPSDAGQIRQAIRDQWRAPRRPGLAEHVLANFTWARTAGQLLEAYRRFAPKGGEGGAS